MQAHIWEAHMMPRRSRNVPDVAQMERGLLSQRQISFEWSPVFFFVREQTVLYNVSLN